MRIALPSISTALQADDEKAGVAATGVSQISHGSNADRFGQ